jgi:cytochrome c-type biogenesis protein CcmF
VIMAVLFLLGVGPALPWRRADVTELKRRLRAPSIALAVVAIASLGLGQRNGFAVAAYAFAAFALTTNLQEYWLGTRARMHAQSEGVFVAFRRLVTANRHRYGGYLAHIGIILAAIGVTASSSSIIESEATLTPGATMSLAGYDFRLEQVWGREQAHRFTVGTDIAVSKNGRAVAEMNPLQHYYKSSDTPVPTPAVRSSFARDIYITLMAFDAQGKSATLRVFIKPLIAWIWAGGGIMCLGAGFGLWPVRRRAPSPASAPVIGLPVPAGEPVSRRPELVS